MARIAGFVIAFVWLAALGAAALAQELTEKSLPLIGRIAQDGTSATLDWSAAPAATTTFVEIKRRPYGQIGGATWQTIAPNVQGQAFYTDTSVTPGRAYEYQVIRRVQDVMDVGYWLTGIEVEESRAPGSLYLIVDETIAEPLSAHLARYQRDLFAAGYDVSRVNVPRHNGSDAAQTLSNAAQIRVWLQEQYQSDPFGNHTIVLVGHVPIVLSGKTAPDGHEARPHPTDLFYADMDGRWSLDRSGPAVMNNAVPTGDIEMQIGRIDFAGMGGTAQELALLRSYLDKTHHWRTGLLRSATGAYAENNNLLVERHSLLNVVGPEALESGGHDDLGEQRPWRFGVDFGHHNGASYATNYGNKAAFTINFGSNKQMFHLGNNAMRALLAQPFYPLTVGWGGRPSWRLHHMALGGSMGEAHFRTVNNGEPGAPYRDSMDYWPTGSYLWQNPIWVNLMGDPTLRPFVLPPPSDLTAQRNDAGLELQWSASDAAGVTGYSVHRLSESGETTLLAEALPADQTSYLDHAPPPDIAAYLVRSHGLQDVFAGSFYLSSQGAYAQVGDAPVIAEPIVVTAPSDAPVPLPAAFQAPEGGRILSVLEPPAVGDLRIRDAQWVYTPETGFAGDVSMPYVLSEGVQTAVGVLTISVQ